MGVLQSYSVPAIKYGSSCSTESYPVPASILECPFGPLKMKSPISNTIMVPIFNIDESF